MSEPPSAQRARVSQSAKVVFRIFELVVSVLQLYFAIGDFLAAEAAFFAFCLRRTYRVAPSFWLRRVGAVPNVVISRTFFVETFREFLS